MFLSHVSYNVDRIISLSYLPTGRSEVFSGPCETPGMELFLQKIAAKHREMFSQKSFMMRF